MQVGLKRPISRARTKYADGSLIKHSIVIFKLRQSSFRENIPSHALVNGMFSSRRRRGNSPSFHLVIRKWHGTLFEISPNTAKVMFCKPKQNALGTIANILGPSFCIPAVTPSESSTGHEAQFCHKRATVDTVWSNE